VRASSVLPGLRTRPRILALSGVFLDSPSPASCDVGSFHPGSDPLQSPSPSSRPSGPSAGSVSPEVSLPFNGILERAPRGTGRPTPPRFRSQVFSTSQRFQPARVPRPCFMPQPFLGFLPSEPSPHRDRVPLSRPLAPLQSSTDVLDSSPSQPFTPGFPDVHALAQLPGSPGGYGFPFRRRKVCFPVALGQRTQTARSASFTRFEAFLPP
jgi:hypothetical protein